MDVNDTGTGIAKDRLGDLFTEFTQVGDENSQQQGTGLGLAISRKLCEVMGGTITVRSELNKGSCFTATIPATPAITHTGDDTPSDVNAATSSAKNSATTSVTNSAKNVA